MMANLKKPRYVPLVPFVEASADAPPDGNSA
jgi:hypothetical protein